MRNIIFVLLTFWSFISVRAQEGSSLFFSEAQPKGETELEKIPDEFLGHYRGTKDSLKSIIITSDSIYVELISLEILSKKEVLGNPKLELKDSLLYGIFKDKAIPVIEKNDTLIFGLVTQHLFFKFSDISILKQTNKSILISNADADNNWTVCKISLEKKGIEVAYIDHELEMELIKKQKGISKKMLHDMEVWILDLNASDMKKFMEHDGFNVKELFLMY